MKRRLSIIVFYWCLFSPAFIFATGSSNWKAPDGYKIEIDSSGWAFPVDIKFVPNPKSDSKAPLYYVTELRGKIKVVTQDRSVFVFADEIENLRPTKELPDFKGQFGLTGLCLDAEKAHLYATTVYRKGGLLFNKIMRFASEDGNFGLKGKKVWEMDRFFEKDPSGIAHQIGNCFIGSDRKLYVGVGDAHKPENTQRLEHTNGKLLRINLDGSAPSDNPFYNTQAPWSVASYIYASGLRNPFAIAEGPASRIYIAENGKAVDRLIEVKPGQNYLWEGKDDVMFLNGLVTWTPPIGPASMIYLDEHPLFPQWNQRLLVTATFWAQIQAVWVDEKQEIRKPPVPFLTFAGDLKETQYLVPVASGPDGIYFSGFMPQSDGETHIMKIVPLSQKDAPIPDLSGVGWYARQECAACHSILGKGGGAGPKLDGLITRLQKRLNHSDYEEQLEQVDQERDPRLRQFKKIRRQLRESKGLEKVKLWIRSHLKEPRFDFPGSQKSNLNLSDAQIEGLTEYLMQLTGETEPEAGFSLDSLFESLQFHFSTHTSTWLGWTFFAGIFLGVGVTPFKIYRWIRGFVGGK
ncbi:MAG: PQQ-dependent sugar dehydrogenase [SAR324 cluster bacterium]|nr:PQQ-dependent sugar dehydrogenase [SAR324 cluster bacterium]